jgi:hypothetical protein
VPRDGEEAIRVIVVVVVVGRWILSDCWKLLI